MLRNSATLITSQSLSCLLKLKFHPCVVHISAMIFCRERTRLYMSGKKMFLINHLNIFPSRISSYSHCPTSPSSWVWLPPMELLRISISWPYKVKSYPWSSRLQLSSASYLAPVWSSSEYFHKHFIASALLWSFTFFIPSPPFFFPVATNFHFIKWKPFFSLCPCHNNLLLISSELLMIRAGTGNNNIMYVGVTLRTELYEGQSPSRR